MLHFFFEQTARRWPELPAVEVPPGIDRPERQTVTYAELQRQSHLLAGALHAHVRGECLVAILLPRNSERLYSAQLATLQTGAAYTCIDPAFPDDQVREILEDAQAVAVFTDAAGRSRLERASVGRRAVIEIEALLRTSPREMEPLPPPPWLTPASLAYVIYTSGTTGRPKGVMIEHRSIANLVASDLDEFQLSPEDRVAQGSSPSYDSSVEETWLAFAAGATLVVLDDATVRLGPDLIPWLRRERISVLCPPPTLLRTTGCAQPETALPDLRLVYVGGEALPPDVADRWAKGRRLENGYGPTECTVTSLRTQIQSGTDISIGKPVRGVEAWVLDEALDEVPDGEQGELCHGGVGLARGYHNQPELTAEKFLPHLKFGRIYRTGDRVHRDPAGRFHYHGRIDSQVKLRGYRVELEAIEARLAGCPGVREAACCVHGEGSRQILAAFVVPANPAAPPEPDLLTAALRQALPAYMVPSRLSFLPQLPRTVGGKINRRALPEVTDDDRRPERPAAPPRTDEERRLVAVFQQVFERSSPISIHDDFFSDLGGDSLSAAVAISILREDPATASLTVRDLYEARTPAEIAQRISPVASTEPQPMTRREPANRPVNATLLQAAWLGKDLVLGSSLLYVGTVYLLPALIDTVGLAASVILGPLLLLAILAAYTPLSVALAVFTKRTLIGRYRPLRAPVWGDFYVRNWMVQQTVRRVPWWLLEGTEFQCIALRALGARIGQRVHLHRGVDLRQGGWDLLEIGDDVTVSQDATIRLVEFEDGEIVIGSATLGAGCTLDIHSGVGGNTAVGPDAYLTAWSSLDHGQKVPRGERWDGIPAAPAGTAPPPPPLTAATRQFSPTTAGLGLVLARLALLLFVALPAESLALAFAYFCDVDAERALAWVASPSLDVRILVAFCAVTALGMPLTLAAEAFACRAMGRVRAGVFSRWSAGYIRVWLKTALVDSAGQWLYGTLFWPHWLRAAGMKIGRGCEISGLIDTIPELIEIGDRTFCADGIYLGGPRIHRGTVTLEPVRLGTNTFLGNGVIVAGGQRLPDDILIGVCTAADETKIHSGTAWFGHPPFQLPQRQVIPSDPRLTHAPSALRYVNRVCWELLRFVLPVAPAVALPAWFGLLAAADSAPLPVLLLVAVPLATFGAVASLTTLALAIKWALLGRVQPGVHALWSCWASRWDFHCMAWSFYVPPLAAALGGTLFLNSLLRAAGATVGRNVVFGCGAAQDLPDPDMLTIEDGATVDGAFQAHTFEDRMLKMDRIAIRREASVGRAAVLLYGAEIGTRTRVAPHSVVMKYERLLPGESYAGFPTRVRPRASHAA